ncbi:polysaccharide deacetylase family protein [Coriobacteriales bacterium OH1046]|nr:polysaccharide deacetylase family protein [Coriobacteriales bacterium OH1046]
MSLARIYRGGLPSSKFIDVALGQGARLLIRRSSDRGIRGLMGRQSERRWIRMGHNLIQAGKAKRGRGMHTSGETDMQGKAKRGRGWAIALSVLAAAAVLGFGGYHLWLHRDVRVYVNGVPVDIRYRSSFGEICDEAGVVPEAGDLYSIAGNLIATGGGGPFTVSLDGVELSEAQLDAVEVEGGESFTVRDGDDAVEDSEVVERITAPRLVPAERLAAVTYVSQWGANGIDRVRVGAVSGEEILEEVVQEPRDCVLASVNPVPSDGRRLVCLTFDDGPSPYTAQVLQILEEKGACATFFVLGSNVGPWSDAIQGLEAAGCEVMSHTMNHRNHYATTSDETYRETADAFAALRDCAGVYTSVIRPPYGNWNEHCWISSRGTMSASVIWNVDSRDWELPGADAIVENCTSGIENGDIILLHDGGGDRSQDIEALPRIIDILREQGFELVTLSELMDADDRIPDEAARQYAPMPEDCAWPAQIAE